jgi:hypothetical protein
MKVGNVKLYNGEKVMTNFNTNLVSAPFDCYV